MRNLTAKLQQIWHQWQEIAECIGDFQARLLLTIFYFTFLAPSGIVTSITADLLAIHAQPKESGWIQRASDSSIKQRRKQF